MPYKVILLRIYVGRQVGFIEKYYDFHIWVSGLFSDWLPKTYANKVKPEIPTFC